MQLLVKGIIYNSWQLKPYLIIWNVKNDIFLGKKKEISLECIHLKSGLIVFGLSLMIIILTKFFKIENLNLSTEFISFLAFPLPTPSLPVYSSPHLYLFWLVCLCQDVELWQVYFTTSRILVLCTNSLICGFRSLCSMKTNKTQIRST